MYVFGLAHDSPPANPMIGLITINNALFIKGSNRLDPLWTRSLGPWPSPTPGPAQMYYHMDLISQESNTSVGPTSGPLVIPPSKCPSGPLVWPLDPVWPFSVVALCLDLRSREFFFVDFIWHLNLDRSLDLKIHSTLELVPALRLAPLCSHSWFHGLHQPGDQCHFTIC